MNLHIETLKPHYDNPLTIAAAELITSTVYLGDETTDDYIHSLDTGTGTGYALVEDNSELIGAATISHGGVQTDLMDIAVREQYRNQRYGAALVRYIGAQALERGDDKVVAYTPPESDQRRFFQRLGFVPIPGEDLSDRRLEARPLQLLS